MKSIQQRTGARRVKILYRQNNVVQMFYTMVLGCRKHTKTNFYWMIHLVTSFGEGIYLKLSNLSRQLE